MGANPEDEKRFRVTEVHRCVREAVERARGIFPSGGVLIVAISGGPDSVCLLHVLHALTERDKAARVKESPNRANAAFRLHVAHLHHGQRDEAEGDAAYVRDLARAMGLPFTLGRADVPALARDEKLSIEAAGRAARYRFFARLAEERGAKLVATGHNADDQAETVLLRAFRGAGLRGLRGIPDVGPMPESDGKVIVLRPLLRVPRACIDAYLSEDELTPHLDSTNLDLSLQRNRIRRELLPLAETISPGAKSGLLRIAREAAEDEAALSAFTDAAWARCGRISQGRMELVVEAMPEQDALRRRLLRRAVETLLPESGRGYPEAAIEMFLRECIAGTTAPVRNVPGGLEFTRETDPSATETRLIFRHPHGGDARAPFLAVLSVPGITLIPELGLECIAEEIPLEEARPYAPRKSWEAMTDADTLTPPFLLRTWEPGDRVRLPGQGGTKKLQDLFTDAKIPRAERRHWPVLCDGPDRRVIWVPGLALRPDAWVTPNTRRVYRWRLNRVTGGG